MSARRGAGSGKLTLRFTEDDLASHRYSHSVVKFVGKIPVQMDASAAISALSVAAAAYLGALPDGLERVRSLRSYVSTGSGTQPYAVTASFVVPPEMRDVLLGRRDARSWVELAAPWSGHALVECGAGEVQEVHLVGLPVGLELDVVCQKLLQADVPVADVEYLKDPLHQLSRADAARAFLPASCRLDTLELQGPNGMLAVVKVHRISRLPPAPGAGSYAAAVAGAARSPSRPSAAPAASAGAAAAAVAAAAPASPRAAPQGGQGQQRQQPAQRQQEPRRQQQPPAPRRSPSRTRQRSPPRGRPAAAAAAGGPRCSPGVSPKRQCVDVTASPSLASPNPFGQLTDVADMDADVAAVAAQLTAADSNMPNGSASAGGS